MVQYILTPWRDRDELLLVRDQFYNSDAAVNSEAGFTSVFSLSPSSWSPSPLLLRSMSRQGQSPNQHQESAVLDRATANTPEHMHRGNDVDDRAQDVEHASRHQAQEKLRKTIRHAQHLAVARVSMWMQRGNCPHMVESTALLMAVVLNDEDSATANDGSSTYAVRAAYSAAFSRFVTGLLDGHQDKQRKQSMYSIAKTIGLPATFVELRHQSTHEQLPSLAKLRSAARKALVWIWDYYWKHLGSNEETSGKMHSDPCRTAVLEYLLHGGDGEAQKTETMKALKKYDIAKVLAVVAELQESLPGNQVYLRCLKLSKEIMLTSKDGAWEEVHAKKEDIDMETKEGGDMEEDAGEMKVSASGWMLYEGPWKPRPIGMA